MEKSSRMQRLMTQRTEPDTIITVEPMKEIMQKKTEKYFQLKWKPMMINQDKHQKKKPMIIVKNEWNERDTERKGEKAQNFSN